VLYTWDLPDAFESDIGERAVDAVILKSTSGAQLVHALERVHRGDVVTPGEHDPLSGVATLTEREREVLALLGCGLSNRAIADELYLSVDTVKTHIRKVFTKVEVTNRTQAALFATEHGLTVRRGRSGSPAA
jgi:DNA-binding NarL/FixJ family response regulator